LSPGTPARLVDVLIACLAEDPTARPTARAAAIEVFDAAQAESVVLTPAPDPATEITRRIRATAATAPVLPAQPTTGRLRLYLAVAAVASLASIAAVGVPWFLGRSQVTSQSAAVHPTADRPATVRPEAVLPTPTRQATAAPSRPARTPATRVIEVTTAADSPQIAPGALLQSLVDARALAYAARSPVLLDLVYAPGASKASADRANLATAARNGAIYLGLAFLVKDAVFVDGTTTTARIRATIVTPAYETGQPDSHKVAHPKETVGPSVFSLAMTRDGWRILGLIAP
jgi:hypothetical protein